MTIAAPFKIGQSVRIMQSPLRKEAILDVYTVLRCNEPDSSNPSYVIENDVDHRQRRESHDQLVSVAARATAEDVFQ